MIVQRSPQNSLWFKVLTSTNESIDDSGESWSAPMGRLAGDVLNFSDQPSLYFIKNGWKTISGIYGTWLTKNPKNLYPFNSGRRIYVAQILSEPTFQVGNMIYTEKVRLLREATNLDLKRFGIHRAFRQVL